ncbi:hypothetical protein PHMEG_00020469, partial [Phytophthora megakarya]
VHVTTDPDHVTTGTDQVITGTDQVTTGTDCVDTGTGHLYYRTYNKYFAGCRLTVGADYATTRQMGRVARINGRRETPLGARHPTGRRYYQRTWESKTTLLADDFGAEMDLVDRWIASGEATFGTFWRKDAFGKQCIGSAIDLSLEPSWKIVLRSLRRLRDECRDFIFKAIAKDNFAVAGNVELVFWRTWMCRLEFTWLRRTTTPTLDIVS